MEAPFFSSPVIEKGRYSTLHFLNEGVDDGGPALQGTVSYFFTFSMEEWTMGGRLFKGLFPISSHSQ